MFEAGLFLVEIRWRRDGGGETVERRWWRDGGRWVVAGAFASVNDSLREV